MFSVVSSECYSNCDDKVSISVIVPVYKVEDYLKRCLDSLCAQDFDDVEFILVDDGSPDNCGLICDEYAKKDRRFRVSHKKNGGLSSARNYGIERAKGDFIMFVDSDDWVRSDFCSLAYRLARINSADIVIFCHQVVKDGSRLIDKYLDLKAGYKNTQEGIEILLGKVGVYAWNKIYKRNLFRGIRYPEGRLFEDQPVTWQLICKADRIYFTNEILYYYYMRASSIVHQESYKAVKDRFEMKMLFYDGLKEKGYYNDRIKAQLPKVALTYAMRIQYDPNDIDSYRAEKILRGCHKVPRNMLLHQRIFMFLYLYHKHLFDLCCELCGMRVVNKISIA